MRVQRSAAVTTSKEWGVSLDKVVVIVSRPGTFRAGQTSHNTVKGSAQLKKNVLLVRSGSASAGVIIVN